MNRNYIIICIIICIICFVIYLTKRIFSNFSNSNEIYVSKLDKRAGFYSMLFFMINHYLYCEKYKINFKLDTSEWLFKYKDGWEDYFKNIDMNFNNASNIKNIDNNQISNEFIIKDYKDILNKIYIYNDKTIQHINKISNELNLTKNNYDSIFIRRGDKMIRESVYIKTDDYIDLLLIKNPNCKIIFIQTDDYSIINEADAYLRKKNKPINIVSLCNNEMNGVVVFKTSFKTIHVNQQDYVNKLKNNKPITEYTPDEIYKHTIDMITGIEIIKNSNICILDYQSNVSRFIKLFHNNSNNVFDVSEPNKDIDYNKHICPAYSF